MSKKCCSSFSLAKMKSYLAVMGSMSIMFCMGSAITFGNLGPYLASYLVYQNNKDNITECTTKLQNEYSDYLVKVPWIYSTALVFQAILGPLGGKLDIAIGPRYTCLIGSFLMGLGMFLTYFTCTNLSLFIVTLGIIFGSGFGIGFTGSIVGACAWWPHKKGLVTGLVLSSIGFGITTFSSVQTPYINPYNVPISDKGCGYILNYDQVLHNIPKCFIVLTAILAVLSVIGVTLLFPAHYDIEYIQNRDQQRLNKNMNKNLNINPNGNINGNNNRQSLLNSDQLVSMSANVSKTSPQVNRYDLPFITMTPTRLFAKHIVYHKSINKGSINSTEIPNDNKFLGSSMIQQKSEPATLKTVKNKPKYYVPHINTLKLEMLILDDNEQKIQYTLCESLKSLKFWQLFIICTLNYTLNVFFLSEWKVISQEYFKITDDFFLLIIGNISGVCYGLGRVFWGLFFDYFNSSPKYQFNIGMGTLVFFMTLFVSILPLIHIFFDNNRYFVCIQFSLVLFTTGATYVMMPSTITQTFGIEYAGVIFGALTYMELPSSTAPMILYKYFQDSLITMFIILICLGIFSFILTMMYKTKNNKLELLSPKNWNPNT